jgi:hypothetical protein
VETLDGIIVKGKRPPRYGEVAAFAASAGEAHGAVGMGAAADDATALSPVTSFTSCGVIEEVHCGHDAILEFLFGCDET